MDNVLDFLKKLNIDYKVYSHQAVVTVEEAKAQKIDADFGESKNLFLRNRKGNKHYLVTIEATKQLDLSKLSSILEEKNLSFASSDRLMKFLGLTPGSVSPFGLINDINKEVIYIFDNELLKNTNLGFPPNINTQTIVMTTADFKKYLDSIGNQIFFQDL